MKRPRKKQLPGSPTEWLSHAQSDLNLARLAKNRKGILPEQICFHAQQACEKSLKAALLFKKLEFPLVHDLETLLSIAEKGRLDLPLTLFNIDLLTPYAVETRYPGFEEEITSSDVNEAIRMAEQTVGWACKLIQK
jgi:HEPN domain-containing protein